MSEAALVLDRVGFDYGGVFRLEAVSFALDAGEILGVIGPNGSGKTTLIRLVSGVHAPTDGEIRLHGTPLARLSRRAVAHRVAVVPQELAVAFTFTVEELVLMGRHPHVGGRLFEGPEDLRRVRDAMDLAGVAALRGEPVDRLSGGECQRVLLARALAQEPRVLLLDEPTSHLDLRHVREMVALLRRLSRDRGLAILLVSHDLNVASEVADRLLVLDGGRMVRIGSPAEAMDEAMLESVYGCPVRVEKSPESGRPVVSIRWSEP